METPQNQTQPSQSSPQPNISGNLGGLYAAITAEDEAPIVEERPQKHVSWFMKMVIGFMRLTFWVDLTKRSNEPFFRFLTVTWALVMSILYLSGIITLILCLTSFVHLPLKLENFFNENNIKYDTLEMADYSLSQINITNLHDEKNTYQIPEVKIQSTFGDFLKNKILAITANSVRINLKSHPNEKSNIQWMLDLFSTFNGAEGQKLDVDSLTINNAVLTFSGKKITVPIAFSLTGDYTQDAQTSVSFSINEDFLKAQGSLSLSGPNEEQKLTISITSGSLTLPDYPEEDLTGEIDAKLTNGEIQTVSTKLNLNYGHSLKEIKIDMQKSTSSGFDGELSFSYKNTANAEEEGTDTPIISFSAKFKSLQINEQGSFSTSQPLELNIQHIEQKDLVIDGLETVLNGDLTCKINEAKCQYTLKKNSEGRFTSFIWKHKNKEIVFNQSDSIALLANNKTNFILQLAHPSFQFNLLINNLNLIGYIDKTAHSLEFTSERVQISRLASENQKEIPLALNIQKGEITTPSVQMKGIQFSSDDVFSDTSPVQFETDAFTMTSGLIKKPLSLQMVSLNNQSSIKCQILDSDITFMAKGIFDLFKMTFTGNFMTSPIIIQEMPFDLKELSDYIPQNLNHITGQIRLAGKIHWTNDGNITGPLYLGLKDISFEVENTKIQNLNTVLALQSFMPFISAPSQSFFIEKITNDLNLLNITSTYQISNHTFYFFNLTGEFSGQKLYTTNSSFSLDDINSLIYFKTNKDFKIDDLAPYINLQNLTLSGGTGGFSLPVHVSSVGIDFSDLTLKLNDTTLSATSNDQDIFNLFNSQNSSYYIRGGKFELKELQNLTVNLDGWLLPNKDKHSVEMQEIILPSPLFKEGSLPSVPTSIKKRLNLLFNSESTP